MKIFPNSVFVFGSNREGIHGAGSALFAKKTLGAKQGVGEGFTGKLSLADDVLNCYALPTKSSPIETLSLDDIQEHVYQFLETADSFPDIAFQVTRVGCGLAGFKDEEIYPLFIDRPDNVLLPYRWLKIENPSIENRIIIAGGRNFNNYEQLRDYCDFALSNTKNIQIVSGGAKGADSLGERYADEKGFDLIRFEADWGNLGRFAGFARNEQMAWYGSHLIAFWDGISTGTKGMIDTGIREELKIKKQHY
jgi:hypothetical protein